MFGNLENAQEKIELLPKPVLSDIDKSKNDTLRKIKLASLLGPTLYFYDSSAIVILLPLYEPSLDMLPLIMGFALVCSKIAAIIEYCSGIHVIKHFGLRTTFLSTLVVIGMSTFLVGLLAVTYKLLFYPFFIHCIFILKIVQHVALGVEGTVI